MTAYTIENCADEPIHIPEAIQPYGYLLAVKPQDGIVRIVSANVTQLLRVPVEPGRTRLADLVYEPDQLLGKIRHLYAKLKLERRRHAVNLQLREDVVSDPHQLGYIETVGYQSGEYFVLELESARPFPGSQQLAEYPRDYLQYALPDLYRMDSIEAMAQEITRVVKQITGFDRVMVYRLDERKNGKVIGEAKEPHLEPFLGLHFPASDIPDQARKLYEINWIRLITNIDSTPVPLQPTPSPLVRTPLDMSHSLVRAVSPIHIQYLRNMGVQATMSISLLRGDELWGLIACHHYSPRYIPQSLRLDCETLGQLYSWQLNAKEAELLEISTRDRLDSLERIIEDISSRADFMDQLTELEQPILTLMDACGFAIHSGQSTARIGRVPTDAALRTLVDKLVPKGSEELVTANGLAGVLAEMDGFEGIAGAMIVPLSIKYGYYAVWFREPVTYTIDWAGKDAASCKGEATTVQERLSPRGSFELWQQTVLNECKRWSEQDRRIAGRFNRLLVSHLIEHKVMTEQALEKMRQLDQAKDQFLASISHELRSPLNAILGWTELALFNRNDHDKALEALEIIKRSAQNQAQLINDLLDLSRIVSGTLKLSIHSVDIAEMIADVCDIFRAAMQSKEIKIAVTVDNELNTVLGDPIRLKQILTNLLGNALKFTPRNGRITVTGRREMSCYVISVSDTGKGIRAEELPLVFDRFYQPERSHQRQGLGLGLSIVKNLVELHGGEVAAESPGEGQGAMFTLRLPIAPLTVQKAPPDEDSVVDNAPVGEVARLVGARILAVEDEEDANRFLTLFLRRHGAQVVSAANGVEAWEILNSAREPFDLLLSDIGMPEMDGYQLIKAIRKSDKSDIRSLCAIALTAYAYSTDRVKALKAGFSSYVSKPVDSEELLTVIEAVRRL